MPRILISFAFVSLLLPGCRSGDGLPPETDPATGREALKTALDTWVNGGTMDDLKNGNPPIVAYDPDWEEGAKLVKYVIDPTNARAGVDLLLKVTLTLARPNGKTQDKAVNFSVAIGSQTVVLRKQ